jgi:hypothetical protein
MLITRTRRNDGEQRCARNGLAAVPGQAETAVGKISPRRCHAGEHCYANHPGHERAGCRAPTTEPAVTHDHR